MYSSTGPDLRWQWTGAERPTLIDTEPGLSSQANFWFPSDELAADINELKERIHMTDELALQRTPRQNYGSNYDNRNLVHTDPWSQQVHVGQAYPPGTPIFNQGQYFPAAPDPPPHLGQVNLASYFPVKLPYFAYVTEDSPTGTLVVSVRAIDHGGTQIRYDIVSGNVGNAFNIEGTTGQVFLNTQLDRETLGLYNLTVRARSLETGEECTVPVHIRIVDANDNPPTIDNPTNDNGVVRFVAPCGQENALAGIMSATDRDIGRFGQVYFCLRQS